MTTRRGPRPTHVRPRPPSSGRPAAPPGHPRAPTRTRLATRGPVRSSRGIPLPMRLALVALVVAIAAGVLYVGAGGLTSVAGIVGSTLSGFVEDITATPTPAPTAVVVADAPSIASPTEPYTNQPSADLLVTVPKAVTGDPDYRIRVYLALEGQAAAPIQESPLAAGGRTVIPVELTDGINDFTVTLVGPGGESEPSAMARWVLDTKAPGIKLATPRDGATINRASVELEGRSQGRSTLIARNGTTGDSISGTADADGRFSLSLPLAMGSNRIVIAATDPAGNSSELEIRLARGSGKLRANLGATDYTFRTSALPAGISLYVNVDDPDGQPLEGARVTFTLSIPGVPTVTSDALTDANGRATFQTTIPDGADAGAGSAAVLVRTDRFGRATDQTVITLRK